MPALLPIRSLEARLIDHIIKNMDAYLRDYYDARMDEITLENRPTFGYFGNAPYRIFHLIIEELIKRENLPLKYLKVLLPDNEIELLCDENVKFTPFQPDNVELILTRCRNLETLHYHFYDGLRARIEACSTIINDSIPRLEHLKEINLYDSKIEDETLKVIASNCRFLEFLNIRRTNVTDNGIEYLLNHFSSVRLSLTTFIVDSTEISPSCVMRCLTHLQNLNYFVSDLTIVAGFMILEAREEFAGAFGLRFASTTTILKNSFDVYEVFKKSRKRIASVAKMFENVRHLVLTSIKTSDMPFIKVLIRKMNITHLDLSAEAKPKYFNSFSHLRDAVDSCGPNLISLKLENFDEVDVFYLSTICKKLQELFLINNLYNNINPCEVPNLFQELVEVQIILIRQIVTYELQLNLTTNALFSILSSSNLKKVIVCCQVCFSNNLVGDLIEHGHLQNLQELYIYHCDQISDVTIFDLVHNFEPIKKLEVGFLTYLTEDLVNMMCGYITMKNLDLSLSRVTELPYHLRWSVVNIPFTTRDKFDDYSENLDLDAVFLEI